MNGTWDRGERHTFDGLRTVWFDDMVEGHLQPVDGGRHGWEIIGVAPGGDRYRIAQFQVSYEAEEQARVRGERSATSDESTSTGGLTVNGVWDSGDTHVFEEGSYDLGHWTLKGSWHLSARTSRVFVWELEWHWPGRASERAERRPYAPLPSVVERAHETLESARDACVAWIQREVLRGVLTL